MTRWFVIVLAFACLMPSWSCGGEEPAPQAPPPPPPPTASAAASATPPPPPPPAATVATRATLLHDEPETGGYGAYSYILFKQLPTGERAEALLEAYCGQLPPVSDYAKADPAKLNITYIPVDVEPSASENSDIKWFGQHYDLSRSKAILLSQKLRGAGPYIVTSSRPLTGESLPVRTSSVIDLSMATTKESMQLWVAQFVKVSESPDDWLSHGADSVALKVHDALAILGKSTKLVLSVLPDGRKFLKAMLGG